MTATADHYVWLLVHREADDPEPVVEVFTSYDRASRERSDLILNALTYWAGDEDECERILALLAADKHEEAAHAFAELQEGLTDVETFEIYERPVHGPIEEAIPR